VLADISERSRDINVAKAYVKGEDGATMPMECIRCKDEDKELQLILEKNPDLLPGEQIDPDTPCRWLPIAREMPVPDPRTGADRWSIDFFFADQSAMPTFIECKRFEDSRARREVIGQMFEYAANGHYYWTKEVLQDRAEELATKQSTTLESLLQALQPDDDLDVTSFFERLEHNLREGQVRLVFFMEEAPIELKSVVEFLNRQMERSEVLLVEAKQYRHDGVTVVVPSLFGYTEEARLVKRTVTMPATTGKTWNYESFVADANSRLDQTDVSALEKLYRACIDLGCDIFWGTGKRAGSFKVRHPSIGPKTMFVVYSHGRLDLYFAYLEGTERMESFRDQFKKSVESKLSLTIPEDYQLRYPSYQKEEWIAKVDVLIGILTELLGDRSAA
jgi:hypothetical protein